MSADTDFSVVALVVSLIALVFTLGQLLQQMFSTADGYRRCQRSIIGPWARFTDLDWRWFQFRFETKFTTPEIVLYNQRLRPPRRSLAPGSQLRHDPTLRDVFDLADIPRTEIMVTMDQSHNASTTNQNGDMASWTSFLQQLYCMRADTDVGNSKMLGDLSKTTYDLSVGIKYRERTWDLMPTDMIRPAASTTLGTLLVLAVRLGMKWENVNIKEGSLRATGNGQTLISTIIPGLGICFQYTFHSNDKLKQFGHYDVSWPFLNNREQYEKAHKKITSWATELLSFGYVPGIPELDVPPMPMEGETVVEASRALAMLLHQVGASNSTIQTMTDQWQIEELRKATGGGVTPSAFVINDLIALTSDFLPMRGNTAVAINWPFRMGGAAVSVFLFWECRQVLLQRLKGYVDAHSESSQLGKMLARMKFLEEKYNDDFYCRWHKAKLVDPNVPEQDKLTFLNDLRQAHDETTEYFVELKRVISYTDLLGAHVNLSCRSSFEARGIQDNVGFWKRTAELYVSNVHTLVDELRGKVRAADMKMGDIDIKIEEAWWTLILRGLAWRMSVSTWPSDYSAVIPSKYFDDPTPVYIL